MSSIHASLNNPAERAVNRRSRPPATTARWLPLALLLLVTAATQAARPNQTERGYLVFGFLPIVSTERLVRRFAPLVEYMSSQLGVDIRMETAPNFGEFLRRTHQGHRYDILFTAPHFYQLARKRAGYRALVRVDLPDMRAVIVVRKDSGLASLPDLKGRRLATADPTALATLLVRAALASQGIDPHRDITLVSTPSHNASLLSAYQGHTEAAGLMQPLYRRAAPEVLQAMRIIGRTAPSPHMPISVAPWVDADLARRIQRVLLDLDQSAIGKALLKTLDWPGFTLTRPGDYEQLDWATGFSVDE